MFGCMNASHMYIVYVYICMYRGVYLYMYVGVHICVRVLVWVLIVYLCLYVCVWLRVTGFRIYSVRSGPVAVDSDPIRIRARCGPDT